MKYLLMCGGKYKGEEELPRHMTLVEGEPLVQRTIRMLRDLGIEDIAITSNNPIFEQFGVPVLHHENTYSARKYNDWDGHWVDAFYPMDEPVCYIFGDVVFTENALRKIVQTETNSIQFFASAPPFSRLFPKTSAEPFALKVVDTDLLKTSIDRVKQLYEWGCFARRPIMWELWQVIKGTPINKINYSNYVVINDATCDL